MKSLTFYLVVIIIILAGLAYTFYDLNKKHKADAARWENNFNEVQKQFSQIDVTLREFKKGIDNKTDSILKIANLKPQNVTQVTNYITNYTDTTIKVISPEFEQKTGTYPFVDKEGCFEFSGYMKIKDTIPELTVNNRKFNNDFTDIEHWERDTIHFLGLNIPNYWRKKWLTYTIIDNCTGEKRVKKINVK